MDVRGQTGMARPTTSRPMTSSRAVTGGGLFGPISSRGKTALRRQVQDKSYFIGIIKSKISEINNERAVLQRESDIMAKEEARIGVYREKAEDLAVQLKELNLELSTYNEFLDRSRTGASVENVNEDIAVVKAENLALSANLESDFAKLKNYEKMVKKNEEELNRIIADTNQVKAQFTDEQRATYASLSKVHQDLSRESSRLESEISHWRARKEKLESTILDDEENLSKIQLLKSMEKLRELEKQKSELDATSNNEESEIADLLAQIKRDNTFITSVESNIQELNKNLEEVRREKQFLSDPDKIAKLSDLKSKDAQYDENLNKFEQKREELLAEIQMKNHDISDLSSKLSRSVKYSNGLRRLDQESQMILHQLIIDKRKAELELHRLTQTKSKNQMEHSSNLDKLSKLTEQITTYSDVGRLKQQMENKLSTIENEIIEKKRQVEELQLELTQVESRQREAEVQFQQHPHHYKLQELEAKMADVSKTLATLKANDQTQLLAELRALTMDKVKKYNQNLLGF